MSKQQHIWPRYQQGIATLAISLILLSILTVVTLYSAKVGLLKQRLSANEMNAKTAQANADALIDNGIRFLRANKVNMYSTSATGWLLDGSERWIACADADTDLPCGNGTTNQFGGGFAYYEDPGAGTEPYVTEISDANNQRFLYVVARCEDADDNAVCDDANPATVEVEPGPEALGVFTLVAQSNADLDTNATGWVQQGVYLVPLIASTPDAPMVVAGNANVGGSFEIVANPNGGGPGVPLSVWSDVDVTVTNGTTCHLHEFLANGTPSADEIQSCDDCSCPTDTAITHMSEGIDILDIDGGAGVNPDATNFPSDVFEYVFGVPESAYQQIKDQAEQPANGCPDLDANSSGLYWVTTHCTLNSSDVIGSIDGPVILVIEEADLTMNGNASIYGIVFTFDAPDQAGTGGTVKLVGNNMIYGAFLSNFEISTTGNFRARYDATVLANLSGAATATPGKIPGTWADYY